jgi:hypothetical protein
MAEAAALHACVRAQDEEDEDEGGEDNAAGDAAAAASGAEVRTGRDADAGEDAQEHGLHPQEIDAYWLQRRVGAAFGDLDADTGQKLAEEVLATLQARSSVHAFCAFFCRAPWPACAAIVHLFERVFLVPPHSGPPVLSLAIWLLAFNYRCGCMRTCLRAHPSLGHPVHLCTCC